MAPRDAAPSGPNYSAIKGGIIRCIKVCRSLEAGGKMPNMSMILLRLPPSTQSQTAEAKNGHSGRHGQEMARISQEMWSGSPDGSGFCFMKAYIINHKRWFAFIGIKRNSNSRIENDSHESYIGCFRS